MFFQLCNIVKYKCKIPNWQRRRGAHTSRYYRCYKKQSQVLSFVVKGDKKAPPNAEIRWNPTAPPPARFLSSRAPPIQLHQRFLLGSSLLILNPSASCEVGELGILRSEAPRALVRSEFSGMILWGMKTEFSFHPSWCASWIDCSPFFCWNFPAVVLDIEIIQSSC
jgi:hypothetical protein